MTVLNVLIIFTVVVVLAYLVLFIAGVCHRKQLWTDVIGSFLRHVLGGAGIALAVSLVVVFALTAYYSSPQGPLALTFLGPLALFVGGLIGASRWFIKRAAA